MRVAIGSSILALLLIAIGTFFYSKTVVIQEMIDAARLNDAQAIAARFDWPAVREYMKKTLVENKKATAMFGDVGPPAAQIPAIVDYYMQPENIDIAFYLHQQLFPTVKEEDFIDSTGYVFPFGFRITLGVPQNLANANDIPQIMRDRLKVTFVFRLDGMTWKIKEMRVPLLMVPPTVYDVPAVKIYGRPQKPG
jgi:hypothetical protein